MQNMSSFKYVTRNSVDFALQINENPELEEHEVHGQFYWKIKNVFKHPEKAIEYLQNWPVLIPPNYTYTPGGRQNFTPIDVAPLVKAYAAIGEAITGDQYNPASFITSSNVVDKDTKCWEGSWHPHTDHDMVFNLWLCKWTEGTGLYTYKGFYDSRDYDGTPDQKLNTNKISSWQNHWSGDDYEHYHTLTCEYNSLYVYNGKLFHGTIMGTGEGPRYSLISFYRPKESF